MMNRKINNRKKEKTIYHKAVSGTNRIDISHFL